MQNIIQTLDWLNQRRILALFVGAGVSQSCGGPSWNQLIDDLSYLVWGEKLHSESERENTKIARSLRIECGDRFEELVEDVLYSYDLRFSDLILSIPDSGITRICNYNFDHFLEAAFQLQGVKYKVSLPGDTLTYHPAEPVIFHPHGFLEYTGSRTNIVFGENEYHNLYSDPYSWSNMIQLNLLLNNSVLFVGMSLTDPNLRRLVDISNKISSRTHYAVFKKKENKVMQRALEKDLHSLKVEPVWVDDYSELVDIFTYIIRVPESKNDRRARINKHTQAINSRERIRRIERIARKLSPNKRNQTDA